MTMEIGPNNLPDLVAGLGMLAVAALLLWVAPTNRVHRAFALLQVVNAGLSLSYAAAVGHDITDPRLSVVWNRMSMYFALALPFAAAFFMLRFLDPDGRLRFTRPIASGLLVGVAGVMGAFAVDGKTVNWIRADGTPVLGPLGFMDFLAVPTSAAIALVFALRARRAETTARRDGLVMASLAFALIGTFWSIFHVGAYLISPETYILSRSIGNPISLAVGRASYWFAMIAMLATAVLVLVAPPLANDPHVRRSRLVFGLGMMLAILLGLAALGLVRLDASAFARLPSTLDGVLRVVATGALAFALLRRQLFDIEVKLRFAISRSTIAAVFIAVFFLASEGAQIVFGAENEWVGLFAAGALVFAIAPLQRVAERLAEKAVPVDTGLADFATARRATAGSDIERPYRQALRIALRDGHLSHEDEVHLAELAEALGIRAGRALALMREAEPDREVPSE